MMLHYLVIIAQSNKDCSVVGAQKSVWHLKHEMVGNKVWQQTDHIAVCRLRK
jgi:hypothetical protein